MTAIRDRSGFKDPLTVGLVISLFVHLGVLMMRFAPPGEIRFLPSESQLEVILLNARSREAPLTPEVLAQVDMEGGGDPRHGRAARRCVIRRRKRAGRQGCGQDRRIP